MEPEEVIIQFAVENADAIKGIKEIEKAISSVQGVADDMHKGWAKNHKQMRAQWQNWREDIQGVNTSMEKLTEHYLKSSIRGALTNLNEVIQQTEYLRASAALTGSEFQGLMDGIMDAANETGLAFEVVANKARSIYDFTGVTEGLGEIVSAGSKMSRVFGLVGDEFERFAAFTIKWSRGTITATDLMEKFDNIVGITGDKMGTLLDNLTQIGRTMARIHGSGKDFARVMDGVVGTIAEMAAEFQQLGGEADVLTDLANQVADPRQWNELMNTIPGIASHIHELNAALNSGDGETFRRLMVRAAKDSQDMLSGLPPLARGATDFDFQAIGILAEMGETAGTTANAMQAQATVMERAAALAQDWGVTMNRLFNNVASVFMRILGPALREILDAFAALNEALRQNRDSGIGLVDVLAEAARWVAVAVGFFVRLTAGLVNLVGTGPAVIGFFVTVLGFFKLLRGAIGGIINMITGGLTQAISALGKGVGEGLEQVSNSVAKIGEKSGKIVAGAFALMMLGGALLLVALSMKIMGEADLAKAALGLLLAVGALVALAVVATYTVGPVLAASAALLLLGTALLVTAFAMGLLGSVVTEVNFAQAAAGIAATAAAVFALGMASMVSAGPMMLGAFAIMALIIPLSIAAVALMSAANSARTLEDATETMTKDIAKLADAVSTLHNAASLMASSRDGFEAVLEVLDIIVMSLSQLRDVPSYDVDEVIESVDGLLDIFLKIGDSAGDMITAARKASAGGPDLQAGVEAIFGTKTGGGFITTAIETIVERLQGFWGNKDIERNVRESITFVISAMTEIISSIDKLYAVGAMLNQSGRRGREFQSNIRDARYFLTDIAVDSVQQIFKELEEGWGTTTLDSSVRDSLDGAIKVLTSLTVDIISGLAALGDLAFIDLEMGWLKSSTHSRMGNQITKGVGFIIGIITKTVELLDQKLDDFEVDEDMQKSIESAMNVMRIVPDIARELAVLGAQMQMQLNTGGGSIGFMAATRKAIYGLFGERGILVEMANLVDDFVEQDRFSNLNDALSTLEMFNSRLAEVRVNMTREVSVSARGGAELAVGEYERAKTAHQQTVETLLGQILEQMEISNSQQGGSHPVEGSMRSSSRVPFYEFAMDDGGEF